MNYSDKIISIAKRNHNTKRQYLLVNPLQGKHIPVDPNECLNMMHEFGEQLYSEFPNIGLIIGFAETATAIGAAIASISKNTTYITTTRENINGPTIKFKEEHSHAVDQELAAENLGFLFSDNDTIVLIDDELSTGKTVLNIIAALKEKYWVLKNKRIIAASLINRMSDENLERFNNAGIECRWLVKIDNDNYDYINTFEAFDPVKINYTENSYKITNCQSIIFKNARTGVLAKAYTNIIENESKRIIDSIKDEINKTDKILVLGTEEYMYPAILFAKELSKIVTNVRTHSTTRSPISISTVENYPIKNGYKIHSFYSEIRDTYLYNLDSYDKVFIITDSSNIEASITATNDIVDLVSSYGCKNIYLIRQ